MSEVLFDFYQILVQNIFGSFGLAILGIAFVIFIILILCRIGMSFIFYWLFFYFLVMGTMYLGAIGLVFGFIFSVVYTAIAFIRFFLRTD